MQNPFKSLDDQIEKEVRDKVAVGVDAALSQVPMLADLLEGKPVELVMTIQLRKKE